jgi:SNF2 family DNA or RNA helicase
VLSSLPPVLESQTVLELPPLQRKTYDEVLKTAYSTDGQQFLAVLNQLRAICDYDPKTEASVKIDRIVEITRSVELADQKAIVFSYLLYPLRLLFKRLLDDRRSQPLFLHGGLTAKERDILLTRFRNDPTVHVLLASSRVGSEGLTLPEANHAIFLNEWWNPSANNQARDRIVRIGQKNIVHVHRFLCRNTVEELLERIIANKTQIFSETIDELAMTRAGLTQRASDVLHVLQSELVCSVSRR